MSAKYRGKTPDGNTRGKYVRKAYWFTSDDKSKILKLDEAINNFLSDKGYETCYLDKEYKNEYEIRIHAYHIAGATISVKTDISEKAWYDRIKKSELCALPQNYVYLRIISNCSIDDVVQKIIKQFGNLQETDPEKF